MVRGRRGEERGVGGRLGQRARWVTGRDKRRRKGHATNRERRNRQRAAIGRKFLRGRERAVIGRNAKILRGRQMWRGREPKMGRGREIWRRREVRRQGEKTTIGGNGGWDGECRGRRKRLGECWGKRKRLGRREGDRPNRRRNTVRGMETWASPWTARGKRGAGGERPRRGRDQRRQCSARWERKRHWQ